MNLLAAFALIFIINILIFFPSTSLASSQKVTKEFPPSVGVFYQKINYQAGSVRNNVNALKINLSDPFTQVQLGIADPLNKLETLRNKAAQYNKPGNQVVGAINGGFFNVKDRIPVHLISKDNRLVMAGGVSKNTGTYVNKPISFGIDEDGKGLIDRYDLTFNYRFNGKTYKISGNNEPRKKNDTILYTTEFYESTTATNKYGTEIVFETSYHPKLTFGSTYKVKVSAVRKAGDETPIKIPKNGFVLSGHGTASDRLARMNVGDAVEINVDIDDKWKQSAFMLVGGPQLVKNGQVDMTIDPDSYVAKAVAPRTAVAVDKTGEKVFFVTVDGRQEKESPGMNLAQFAQLLVDLGADAALNLDGGGSTLMAVRSPGHDGLDVANKPSDGFERGTSTILMAVDTEPVKQIFIDVSYRDAHYPGVNWLKDNGIQGYPDHTFGVDEKLSRPHTAIMFTKSLKLKLPPAEEVENLFNDVDRNDLYADYIAAVGQANIFNGSNGDFLPEQGLTRQQMATTLVNAYALKDNGADVQVNLSNVDPSHKKNVQILANLGITNQLSDFRPREPVTRGQFATFLYKANQS
ncbi:phosphodiester glycosidase family protein [Virgibacillus halodenitrificans]|uniref:phosphodiester glycosidase family protein n=1 Tax=Virgibacillus halodenitrificans TaxID=1482 RepID=UPI001F19CB36|nr:phosphodiester glycosidase family protein [Virgibacillus halodenitrificans]MCG1027052.1 phosphodiester glycosidase family protein [Virgibacillus halodenitrificans]